MRADERDKCAATGKVVFPTEADAVAELAAITVRAMQGSRRGNAHWEGDTSPLECGTFECGRGCGGWHLTSRPWNGAVVNPRGA